MKPTRICRRRMPWTTYKTPAGCLRCPRSVRFLTDANAVALVPDEPASGTDSRPFADDRSDAQNWVLLSISTPL